MYFGTPSGISIFDGTAFNNFELSKGFRHNMVSDIKELKNNEFALFTRSNQFYHLVNNKLQIDSVSQKAAIKNLYHDKSGKWYAAAFEGLYIFNNGKLDKLPVDPGKNFYGINCVMEWRDSLMIIGRSYESLDIYNTKTWKLIASSTEKLFVRNLFADDAGNVWISSIGNGVLLLKPSSVQGNRIEFEKLPSFFNVFSHTEFRAVVQDKEKNLWMAGINNGLIKYNPATGSFMHITLEQGLISNTLFSLYCDAEDNIWIGTNHGVQKLVHKNVFLYAAKQGLPADLVLDVLPLPGNRIVTCGYSGVGYIKGFGEKVTVWNPPLQDEYFTRFVSLQNDFFGLSLKKLIELEISPDKIEAKKIYPLPEHFRSMVPFQENKILLGGDSSILILNNGKMSVLTKESVEYISCMAFGPTGILWTGGLGNTIVGYKLNTATNKIAASAAYRHIPATIGGQDYIQCIAANKNLIAYGTSQSGIHVAEIMNNTLSEKTLINISTGLSNNNIYFLSWFNDTTLLAGTGDGLDKIIFKPKTDSPFVYKLTKYYNISNTVYSAKKDASGNILLATEAGLIIIPTIDVEHDASKELPVTISSVRLLNYPDSILNTASTVKLPYNMNNISISFASPSFTNEKNIKYTYLLSGSNQTIWSTPSFSGSVEFSNLPPGNYRFMVKPVNMYGAVSSSVASLEIIIKPAFWQTWWFFLLLFLFAAAGIYFSVRKRIQNIRRESNFKTKIVETEMMALRAQMNPHFIFNCMNIIDGLITDNRKEDAQDFLQKFSKLIRLVLENSQYQQVPLQQDLEALTLYTELEAIRCNHHFTCHFDVDERLIEDDYKIPPLLLQPYIENAIVHGLRNKENEPGRLLISIKKDNDKIIATIIDNGIGRKKATQLNEENKKPHDHLGMKVTGRRISLLQMMNDGKVEIYINDIENQNETGTCVTIILPYYLKFE